MIGQFYDCHRGAGPLVRRISATFFAIFVCFGSSLPAEAASVGVVTKVVNQATIGGRAAVAGSPVNMNQELRTGAGARLQVTFQDRSQLTLGENARVVVDTYTYNPKKSSANVVLNATQGAFRFAGGKIEQMQKKNVTVNTPNAALAVRGTHFWAGPVDGKYGVLLLKGKVRVSKR
jgi:hypothetical protein